MKIERHFELTGETKVNESGITLHRIRATKNIPYVAILGTVGGWVENPDNIKGETAWIGDEAELSGNAIAKGCCVIYENAIVSDGAIIEGFTRVYGNARVGGSSHLRGATFVSGSVHIGGDIEIINKYIVSNEDISAAIPEIKTNEFIASTGLKKLNFKKEDKKASEIVILKKAYEQYAGVKFGVYREWEFNSLLDSAKADMEGSGRNLELESYTYLESRLFERIRLSLFGQWSNSTYGQPDDCLKEVRALFVNAYEFVTYITKRFNDMSDYQLNFKKGEVVLAIKLDQEWIKGVFNGTEQPTRKIYGY